MQLFSISIINDNVQLNVFFLTDFSMLIICLIFQESQENLQESSTSQFDVGLEDSSSPPTSEQGKLIILVACTAGGY